MASSMVNLYLMTLAGTPPIIEYGGQDLLTTAPAAIIDPRPIVTPDRIVTLIPNHESPSIMTSLSFSGLLGISASNM